MMERCRKMLRAPPPIVSMADGTVGHLLAWELAEVNGTWHAWVRWVQQASGRPVHKIVSFGAAALQPLEEPESYSQVPGACADATERSVPGRAR